MIRSPSVMNRFTIMPYSSESYLHQKTYANKCCFPKTSSIHDRYLARYMAIGIHAFMYSNRIHIHPSISIHPALRSLHVQSHPSINLYSNNLYPYSNTPFISIYPYIFHPSIHQYSVYLYSSLTYNSSIDTPSITYQF